jgi:hypothetical protein
MSDPFVDMLRTHLTREEFDIFVQEADEMGMTLMQFNTYLIRLGKERNRIERAGKTTPRIPPLVRDRDGG